MTNTVEYYSHQVLNQYKKRLQTLTQESDRLSSEFKSRNELSEKIVAEFAGVDADRIKAEEVNQAIRKETADFRVPDVLEYVKETATLQVRSSSLISAILKMGRPQLRA